VVSRISGILQFIAFSVAVVFPHAGTAECCAIEHATSPGTGHENCCRDEAEDEDVSHPCCVYCHLDWTGIPAHSTIRISTLDAMAPKFGNGFGTWLTGGARPALNFVSVTEPPPPRLATLLTLICVRLI
jgi:hypothetical protein